MHNDDYTQLIDAVYYLDSATMLLEYDCIDAAKDRVELAMSALRLYLKLHKVPLDN